MVHLHYGPVTRSPSLKMASSIGFRMGSFLPTLLFKLRGLDSYPGGTFTHWFMPAFAGRTHISTDRSVDECIGDGARLVRRNHRLLMQRVPLSPRRAGLRWP